MFIEFIKEITEQFNSGFHSSSLRDCKIVFKKLKKYITKKRINICGQTSKKRKEFSNKMLTLKPKE
jgi:hypothetical protein